MNTANFNFKNSLDRSLRIIDPLTNKPTITVLKGCSSVQYRNLPSANGTGLNATWTLYPQRRQVVSNYFLNEYDVTIAVSGTSDGTAAPNFVDGYVAPRAFSLLQATDTMSITIGGEKIDISPADMAQAILAFNKTAEMNDTDFSMTGVMLDAFCEPGNGCLPKWV